MQHPIEVIFQRADATPQAEAAVFDAVAQLGQFCDRLTGVQVFVRGPAATDDGVYAVNLTIRTPECEITIAAPRTCNPAHRELRSALRDAFVHAERQLQALQESCTCTTTDPSLHA